MQKLKDVSMHRLLNHSEPFCFMFIDGVKYEVMKSTTSKPIQQFYVVGANWRDFDVTARVILHGHGYKRV